MRSHAIWRRWIAPTLNSSTSSHLSTCVLRGSVYILFYSLFPIFDYVLAPSTSPSPRPRAISSIRPTTVSPKKIRPNSPQLAVISESVAIRVRVSSRESEPQMKRIADSSSLVKNVHSTTANSFTRRFSASIRAIDCSEISMTNKSRTSTEPYAVISIANCLIFSIRV